MAAQHLTRREFEDWRDNMIGFVETTLDKNVRASERRMIAEINRSANEVRADLTKKMEDVRTELTTKIEDVRTELTTKIEDVRTELVGMIKASQDEFRTENRGTRSDLVNIRSDIRYLEEVAMLLMTHFGITPPKRH